MKRSLGARLLVMPTPAWVVGTYGADGAANVMTAAWGTLIGVSPPCLILAIGSGSETYRNILARRAFTVNVPGEAHWREVDYFGCVSARDHDKLREVGWTPIKSEAVDAPLVAECSVSVACRLLEVVSVAGKPKVVGEIVDVVADDEVLTEGVPDIQKVKPLVYDESGDAYSAVGRRLGKGFSQRSPPEK